LLVTACSLTEGTVRWTHTTPTSDPVENGTFVSRAAPTPVVDEQGVYAFFESGDVVALTHDGKSRWSSSLSAKYGKFENTYGLAASPVLHGNRLFLLIDHPGPSYVMALQRETGVERWRITRTSRGSWTSPLLMQIAGRPQLVCSSAGTVDGYDVEDGQLLWSHTGIGGNRICSPTIAGEGTLLIGSQTSREFADTESVKKANMALKVTFRDSVWSTEVAWRSEDAVPGMASPIAHHDCAYWINRSGVITCLDATTGRVHYTERTAQSCWATPVGLGDRVYFFGKDGLTSVIAAGPEFKLLAENRVWNPESVKPDQSIIDREADPKRKAGAAMHALPEIYGVAVISGSLLIRTGTDLYCVRQEPAAETKSE
jgi:outer membrane protein assembly factor BamB